MNENELDVLSGVRVAGPQVECTWGDPAEQHGPFNFYEDLIREGENYDPATISDVDLVMLTERAMDVQLGTISGVKHSVSRPDTGRWLIGPPAVYGLVNIRRIREMIDTELALAPVRIEPIISELAEYVEHLERTMHKMIPQVCKMRGVKKWIWLWLLKHDED